MFDSRQFRKDSVHSFLLDYFIQDDIDCESTLLRKDPRILLIRMADCIHNTMMLPYMGNAAYREWFLQQNFNFRIPLARQLGFTKIATHLQQVSDSFLGAPVKRGPLIFLCYAREDKRKIDRIYKHLMRSGFRPWMDKPPKPYEMSGIKPGENWDQSIRNMIYNAEYLLACLSRKLVVKKGYVQTEFRRSLRIMNETSAGQLFLIPVLMEKCEVFDIQVEDFHFKNLQWFELYKRSISDLISFITEDYSRRREK